MTPFDIAEPETLPEALAMLDPDDGSVRPIAGGTALMLMMKACVFRPTRLVSLRKLAGFDAIESTPAGELRIGAMTPLADIERSAAVRAHAPVITRTLRTLSNIRVRNVATIGGHLAHADPHMDLPPVLIALGAGVTAASRSGERTIAAEELLSGYFETVLGKDELISAVMVPDQGRRRSAYLKCTTRAVHDWPALGVAVSIDGDRKSMKDPRVVISAASEKPARLLQAEGVLRDCGLDEASLRRAGDAAAQEAQVIADAQGSAAYKRELVRVYVVRALRAAVAETSGLH
ncbi:MAG TPA: xanthine dehydrogenase family protein subunit M [Xanthobacteraceae bacterium]|jgi:carbon-monoxide dehydrogenase medium subunit